MYVLPYDIGFESKGRERWMGRAGRASESDVIAEEPISSGQLTNLGQNATAEHTRVDSLRRARHYASAALCRWPLGELGELGRGTFRAPQGVELYAMRSAG